MSDTTHDTTPAATRRATSPELGLDTFGDVTFDANGTPLPHHQVIRNIIDQAVLADSVGVDFIGVGEHHRDDFAVSAPDIVLSAIAARTERIRMGSAVTVLSSDDPIRVFQRFSTIDAISSGRAEVILGRGSFTESFPLFGFDLMQYEELFEEKLDLFSHLLTEEPLNWNGRLRAPLRNQRVYPPTQNGLKTWIAVGGSPESVIRAAKHRIPLMLAVIGGPVEQFVPFADLYRRANDQLEQPQASIGVHSPGHIAETDAEAREHLREHWIANRNRIGRERGWGPAGEREIASEIEEGALYVGSPDTVAVKIAHAVRTLGVDRFDFKYANGPMPHEQLMRSIELYGTEVIPRVRALLAD